MDEVDKWVSTDVKGPEMFLGFLEANKKSLSDYLFNVITPEFMNKTGIYKYDPADVISFLCGHDSALLSGGIREFTKQAYDIVGYPLKTEERLIKQREQRILSEYL